jgi:hypothetical protein
MAYLQVSPLRGSHDETWRGEGIRKRSVSWNLPKLSQSWLSKEGFGPSTTQNHLWPKKFVSGTRNFSRVAACALRNEQVGSGHGPRPFFFAESTVTGINYLDMQQLWLMSQLQEDSEVFILQHDGAPATLPFWLCKEKWSRPIVPASLFLLQHTGSHSAGISCATQKLFCL